MTLRETWIQLHTFPFQTYNFSILTKNIAGNLPRVILWLRAIISHENNHTKKIPTIEIQLYLRSELGSELLCQGPCSLEIEKTTLNMQFKHSQ